MMNNNEWRFCIVGNIKQSHKSEDENKILYGTKAFSGGTKIYIEDRTFGRGDCEANVIGLNRFGRYAVESVPIDLIENIRLQRIYKPTVLKIMSYLEQVDGWVWRGRTAQDRRELEAFVVAWKR